MPLQVDKDLREMLVQPGAPPPKKIGIRVWPKAIPQFNLGHLETVQVGWGCLPPQRTTACPALR